MEYPRWFRPPKGCARCRFLGVVEETNEFTCVNWPCAIFSRLERALIEALAYEPRTRDELVGMFRVARTTIYDALEKLMTKQLVKRGTRWHPGRGRPETLFQVKP